MTGPNEPQQILIDGVVDYLAALDDTEFDAVIAQARPPIDPDDPAPKRGTGGSAGAKEAERRFGKKA